MTRKKFVLVGGFATGEKELGRVVDAARHVGLVGMGTDVDAFTLDEAVRNPRKVVESANGATVAVHSLGHIMLRPIAERTARAGATGGYRPEGIMSFNRIMPKSEAGLVLGALERFGMHASQLRDDAANRRILWDYRLALTKPGGNLGQVPVASKYNTDIVLEGLMDASVPVVGVISGRDEFGKEYMQLPSSPSLAEAFRKDDAYCHDGILLDPEEFLEIAAYNI